MREILKLSVIALALAAPLAAQTPRPAGSDLKDLEPPTLTVAGTGQARVAPDQATVRLGVLAQATTAREAQNQVNRSAQAVLDAIRKLGIPPERIQTTGLSLNPQYAQGKPDQGPRITGYQASNTVTVLVEDLSKVGPVIDAGLTSGANNLDGVDFGLRNDAAVRASALTNAVESARVKAEALARALKLKLVEILEVAEGGVSVSPPPSPFRGRIAMAAEAVATPVSAGEVGVEASVTIRWRIAPCPSDGPCS
ncbi:MAG TPA: SIMPL domain-containing protein [Thermoanaerobaculia bacterium]|nr:SIMPL domain-containing protein [Thermoanaerobaculia bacterium]